MRPQYAPRRQGLMEVEITNLESSRSHVFLLVEGFGCLLNYLALTLHQACFRLGIPKFGSRTWHLGGSTATLLYISILYYYPLSLYNAKFETLISDLVGSSLGLPWVQALVDWDPSGKASQTFSFALKIERCKRPNLDFKGVIPWAFETISRHF